jgi:hypothetical protein
VTDTEVKSTIAYLDPDGCPKCGENLMLIAGTSEMWPHLMGECGTWVPKFWPYTEGK